MRWETLDEDEDCRIRGLERGICTHSIKRKVVNRWCIWLTKRLHKL